MGPLVRRMWPATFHDLDRLPHDDRILVVANHSGMGAAELWSARARLVRALRRDPAHRRHGPPCRLPRPDPPRGAAGPRRRRSDARRRRESAAGGRPDPALSRRRSRSDPPHLASRSRRLRRPQRLDSASRASTASPSSRSASAAATSRSRSSRSGRAIAWLTGLRPSARTARRCPRSRCSPRRSPSAPRARSGFSRPISLFAAWARLADGDDAVDPVTHRLSLPSTDSRGESPSRATTPSTHRVVGALGRTLRDENGERAPSTAPSAPDPSSGTPDLAGDAGGPTLLPCSHLQKPIWWASWSFKWARWQSRFRSATPIPALGSDGPIPLATFQAEGSSCAILIRGDSSSRAVEKAVGRGGQRSPRAPVAQAAQLVSTHRRRARLPPLAARDRPVALARAHRSDYTAQKTLNALLGRRSATRAQGPAWSATAPAGQSRPAGRPAPRSPRRAGASRSGADAVPGLSRASRSASGEPVGSPCPGRPQRL